MKHMSSLLLCLVIAITAIASSTNTNVFVSAQNCNAAPDCQQCVSQPTCGWCSINTTLPNGQSAPQCQQVSTKGSGWECFGMFSIEQCQIGYSCDEENFQCVANQNGNGKTLQDCQKNCTNNGKVYTCNKTNPEHPQCVEAPAGTPGSQSLLACKNQCMLHPTATATNTGAPHSHAPAPSTTTVGLFACNYTSGTCEPSVPGKGSSKEVCEQTCKKSTQGYTCDLATQTCNELPPNIPGPTKEECENKCNPTAAPKPPPTFPLGLYRGVQIDNDYNMGTVFVDVEETSFTMVMMKNGNVESYMEGTPTHIAPHAGNENTDIMIIDITAPSSLAGKKLGSIALTTGLPGPQTTFISMAFNTALDGTYPGSIDSAMTSSSAHVLALAKCQTPFCKFNLPKLPQGMIYEARNRDLFPQSFLEKARRSLAGGVGVGVDGDAASFNDTCSQYGASCSLCLSHPSCGWCGSGPVDYVNGAQGTQCSSGQPGTTPWVCAKDYFTHSCPQGYLCHRSNATCYKAAPGDSSSSLQQCMEQCVSTQTPAPKVQLYYCNLTTSTCEICTAVNCPGSFPKAQCGQCSHHKKGPGPSLKNSDWRGFQINQGYDQNEFQYVFGNTTVAGYKSGQQIFEANVTSFGNDVMVFTYTSGKLKGFKRSMYFQESSEVPSNLYESITFAEGKANGAVPASFPTPMQTPGENVYVFYKCNSAPCKFHTP